MISKGKKVNVIRFAKRFKGKYATKIRVKGTEYDSKITPKKAMLSGVEEPLWMIICRMDGDLEEPIKVFYTDLPLDSMEETLRVSRLYGERWKIEEYFRFKKGEIGMENFRVRSLTAINSLMMALDLSVTFMAEMMEECARLSKEIMLMAKEYRISPIVKYYRFSDGIFEALKNRRKIEFECGRRKREGQTSLEPLFRKALKKSS